MLRKTRAMQNDQFWDQIYNVDDYMKQSDKVRKRNNNNQSNLNNAQTQ